MAEEKETPSVTSTKPTGRKYKYTGAVYPSIKNESGEEAGVYDLFSDGLKLRPWLWTDDDYEKFAAKYPDHQVLARFKKM